MSPIATLLTVAGGLIAVFSVTFFIGRRMNNFGIVDIVWAYAFTPVAWFFAWAGPGAIHRKVLLAVLASAWSLRLGTHLYRRVMRHHPEEDSRYQQLRLDWASNFAPKMFGFFQLQAVSIVILSTPFFFPMRHGDPHLNFGEWMGTIIVVMALIGEFEADRQLSNFRRQPDHFDQVCTIGLWRYSRHPNYFFEWCTWLGFFGFALGSPWGWVSFIAPLSILHLLLNVTGVPMAEASSLQSKGEAFRVYQRTTNAFFPGPSRSR